MHTLTKLTAPGYTKEYQTEDALRDALYKCMCERCLNTYGTSIMDMLFSDCGLSFSVSNNGVDDREAYYDDDEYA